MIFAAAALAAQLANPGFERELHGWQTERHRGMGIAVGGNPGYMVRQSAEGEYYLTMGWRARSAAPREAFGRVFQQIDARRYRGRTIRVSVQTKAPDFAHGNGILSVSAGDRTARTGIATSEDWQRHAVTLRVPRDARTLEIALQVHATSAELSADDVRLTVLR
jgi:hypothetical protein